MLHHLTRVSRDNKTTEKNYIVHLMSDWILSVNSCSYSILLSTEKVIKKIIKIIKNQVSVFVM